MPGQQKCLTWLLDRLRAQGKASGAKILDVGSGTGKPTAETFVAAGHDVTGIDISSEMVKVSRQQVPGAKFEVVDALKYEPAAGQYDAVTAFFALLDEKPQREIKEVIERIASWIKPGGLFVYGTVPVDCDQKPGTWMGRKILMTSFGKDAWLDIVKEKGFEVLDWEECRYQPHTHTWEEPQLFIYAKKK